MPREPSMTLPQKSTSQKQFVGYLPRMGKRALRFGGGGIQRAAMKRLEGELWVVHEIGIFPCGNRLVASRRFERSCVGALNQAAEGCRESDRQQRQECHAVHNVGERLKCRRKLLCRINR